MIPLNNDKQVLAFVKNGLRLECTDAHYMKFDNKTELVVTLTNKINMKQAREIEKMTHTIMQDIILRPDPILPEDTFIELVFLRI